MKNNRGKLGQSREIKSLPRTLIIPREMASGMRQFQAVITLSSARPSHNLHPHRTKPVNRKGTLVHAISEVF
jgi:hypothetical protein